MDQSRILPPAPAPLGAGGGAEAAGVGTTFLPVLASIKSPSRKLHLSTEGRGSRRGPIGPG